jgi:hypothetical protein
LGGITKNRRTSRFDSYNDDSVNLIPKFLSDEDYQKILEEIADLFYDYFSQQRKKSSSLYNKSGEPLIYSEVA